MKRFLLIFLAVLSAVACKKVTPEMRIDQISDYLYAKQDTYASSIRQYEGEKRVDYLTLQLAKELGSEDIWTMEVAGANSLVAEFPGKAKENRQLSIISASLDDPAACAAVLEVLEAFKALKISHKNNIHAIFYNPAKDSTGLSGLAAINREMTEDGDFFTFDIELSSTGNLPRNTFIISDKRAFTEQMDEVVTPYLAPLGDYRLMQGPYPDSEWPLKGPVYRYYLSESTLQKDAAAVAAFAFLLSF